jgi:hypothetical protein
VFFLDLTDKWFVFIGVTNAVLRVAAALLICLVPVALVTRDLADPNIRAAGVPQCAWRLHRSLTPKFERWAKSRLRSPRATKLSTSNISGTEWPLFGCAQLLPRVKNSGRP